MKNYLKIIFFFSAALFIFGVIIENDIIRTIAKPIPLIVLIISVNTRNKYNKLIFIGFIFSLFGDVFLLKVVDLFIFGLGSFLIAHIFYIVAFVNKKNSLNLLSSIPFYVIAAALAIFFIPYLGDMHIPVLIYITVIITMVWRAYVQSKISKIALFAFIGAILFAVSDTNIAFDKFYLDYDYSKIVTIVLYWSAQYFIRLSVGRD